MGYGVRQIGLEPHGVSGSVVGLVQMKVELLGMTGLDARKEGKERIP